MYTETSTQKIGKALKEAEPDIVVVDSIQTLQSDLIDSTPGSISQIKETAGDMIRFAKETGVPVFLIGHITKDGTLAGPKLLEHMVDTVLQFEGDRHHVYRILRSTKNRFGSTNEIGIYEMQSAGLREVSNPSEILISQRDEALSGVTISATLEGMRPLLIETQALVSAAVYGTPQRNSNGYDAKRLNMLLAILEKKCGLKMGLQDVFINIAGGLRIEDPGIDLGIVAAIVSSYENVSVDSKIAFIDDMHITCERIRCNTTCIVVPNIKGIITFVIMCTNQITLQRNVVIKHGISDNTLTFSIIIFRISCLNRGSCHFIFLSVQ